MLYEKVYDKKIYLERISLIKKIANKNADRVNLIYTN